MRSVTDDVPVFMDNTTYKLYYNLKAQSLQNKLFSLSSPKAFFFFIIDIIPVKNVFLHICCLNSELYETSTSVHQL